MVIETWSPQETFALGQRMGREARPGQVICLNGDLGVGKTVFTQGFAEGLGIGEPVNSPTFTILQQYEEGRLPLYHFDVYRIGDGVSLIEWPTRIREILPAQVTWVEIEKDLEKGFDYRRIRVEERA